MALRAFIAAIVALLLFAAGALLVLNQKGVEAADFVALLLSRDTGAGLLCRIAAWGAVAAGGLSVLGAFAAFFEEPEDDGFRRRGFPKVAPVVLFAIGLVLLWTTFDCLMRESAARPQAIIVQAEPLPALVEPQTPPPVEPTLAEEPLVAAVETRETGLTWQYMYPLVVGETVIQSGAMRAALGELFPARDTDGAVREMLCDNAWVAFTGAASEEGPRERNRRRARVRAEMVAARAEAWLDAHANDCRRPVVLAVSLGQHAETAAGAARDGAATGYQRQALMASRPLQAGEGALDPASAMNELRDFLGDPANRRALVGSRTYLDPEIVFDPQRR